MVGKDVAYLGKRVSRSNWARMPQGIMGRVVTVYVTIPLRRICDSNLYQEAGGAAGRKPERRVSVYR